VSFRKSVYSSVSDITSRRTVAHTIHYRPIKAALEHEWRSLILTLTAIRYLIWRATTFTQNNHDDNIPKITLTSSAPQTSQGARLASQIRSYLFPFPDRSSSIKHYIFQEQPYCQVPADQLVVKHRSRPATRPIESHDVTTLRYIVVHHNDFQRRDERVDVASLDWRVTRRFWSA
jgi:hypothetical protein